MPNPDQGFESHVGSCGCGKRKTCLVPQYMKYIYVRTWTLLTRSRTPAPTETSLFAQQRPHLQHRISKRVASSDGGWRLTGVTTGQWTSCNTRQMKMRLRRHDHNCLLCFRPDHRLQIVNIPQWCQILLQGRLGPGLPGDSSSNWVPTTLAGNWCQLASRSSNSPVQATTSPPSAVRRLPFPGGGRSAMLQTVQLSEQDVRHGELSINSRQGLNESTKNKLHELLDKNVKTWRTENLKNRTASTKNAKTWRTNAISPPTMFSTWR